MTTDAPREPVSLAVVNARVATGVARRPWADAVAVRGTALALVGSGAEARKLGALRVVDARGGTLVAGRADVGADGAPCVHPARLAATADPSARTGEAPAPTLERGGVASFVLLDRDVTRAPHEVAAARVVLVVEAGRVTHERPVDPE